MGVTVARALAAFLAALLLAGCGGGSGTTYDSARAVAKAAGCAQVKQAPKGETTLFATDEVECHASGFTLVDWFKDTASRDNFTRAAKGSGTYLLIGDDWAIQCSDKSACEDMKAKVGGSIE